MTWEPGMVTPVEIERLAAQVVANLEAAASDDAVLRLCVGTALAQDLKDDELQNLMAEVETRLGSRAAAVA